MKKYLFICLTFAMVFSFTACDSSQTAINDLETLLHEIETNYQSYTEEDWENMSLSYSAIEEELAKHEYTDEELKEIGCLKGKYLGYQTQHSMNNMEKQIKNAAKEVDGAIEGFVDVFSNDNNN